MAAALACGVMAAPAAYAAALPGSITIDGDARDWAAIDGVQMNTNVNGNLVTSWKAARDAAGNVYLCISGTGNQWGIPNMQWAGFTLTQNGVQKYWNFATLWYQDGVTHALGGDGCSSSTGGPFTMEVCLPAGMITDPEFLLEFNGVSLPAAALPTLDGSEAPAPEEPVYNGIVIDGDFADWDAVSKTDGPGCTNEGHPDCMDSCAMVFDGDYVYVYLRERPGMNAGSAGSHGNGTYAITTDLGRTLLIDLEADGTVAGIEGAQCVHNGTQWELAIPRDALPQYSKSLSFGFYLAEPVISGVQNLDGSSGGGSFAGIVYDGEYADWQDYPHTLIQYATPGTQGKTPDGEFAIYAEGSKLYGHTVTEYAAHLVGGYDLAYAITIAFNGDRSYKDTPDKGNLYPYLVAVDEEGNITYNPNIGNLPNGNHEFYIMDTRSWHSSKNIHDLQGNDRIFGRMTITVEDGREQCEYEIDLEEVAAYIGCDAGDFKLIEAQFGRIGQQWTSTAGASSGAWPGIALCIGAAGLAAVWQRRRMKKA